MAMVSQAPPAEEEVTYYELLGVDEEADLEELTAAYRRLALSEHPDKGGDADRFHEIAKAFKVLSSPEAKSAYDEKLAKAAERAKLVEGGPGASGLHANKQAQAPMPRMKTAPTPGSKRQGKLRCGQPGNYNACAEEWKNMGNASKFLKAICDEITPEQKTEQLMDKYAELPRGKDKKKEWVNSLRGKEKQDLKLAAKKREEAAKAKLMANWLNPAAQAAKAGNKAAQKKPPPPKKATKAAAAESAMQAETSAGEATLAISAAEVAGLSEASRPAAVTA